MSIPLEGSHYRPDGAPAAAPGNEITFGDMKNLDQSECV
jgi:hypothetical protein